MNTLEHELDESDLAQKFTPFLHTGQRIRVETDYGDGEFYSRTGTVGKTTGWKPAYLLMHRSSDIGSWDVLSDRDIITHVQYGRTYIPVANLPRDPNGVK